MIELLFDSSTSLLLVRYRLALSAANLDRLDSTLRAFFRDHALCDTIIDFSQVPDDDVDTALVIDRSHRASREDGKTRRVFVVKDQLQYGLMRIYRARQEARGYTAPDLVHSVDEALELLGAKEPEFEVVQP
jgi:hypothetical protein